MPLLWKFLREGMESEYGNCTWTVGEWKKEEKAEKCSTGFHASETISDAIQYVKGEILARVEVRGECDKDDTKQAWTEMRIKKAYKWTKEESVKLAIFAAYSVLDIYEKQYPEDNRPRLAIEAAEAYVKNPTEENQDAAAYAADAADAAAAHAARAARAAYAADAADAAAVYAADAADAADAAAAYAAADAAHAADAADAADAAYAAYAAADAAAAHAAAKKKIEKYLLSRVKELEEIK